MFQLLNIAKFKTYSKHYYGRLYSVNVDVGWVRDGLYRGNIEIKEPNFTNMEKEYGIVVEKGTTEKEVIQLAYERLLKFTGCDSEVMLVFREGHYSKAMSKYAAKLIKKFIGNSPNNQEF